MQNKPLQKIRSYKYSDIIVLFLLARLIYLLIMLISGNHISTILKLFDAGEYLSIASSGYTSDKQTAFFPFLPILIRFTTQYGAMLVCNLCFAVSILFLKKLGCNFWVLATFALGPMGFFSMLLYTESIFFFFTIVAFYLYKNRKKPVVMGILLGLSVMTRSTGSLLFFAVFIGMCIQCIKKELRFRNIVIAYIPATLISLIYPTYLQITRGNWKLFVDCQYTEWNKVRSSVFKNVLISIKMIFTDTYPFRSDVYEPLEKANEAISLIFLIMFITYVAVSVFAMIKKRKIDAEEITVIAYIILTLLATNSTIKNPYVDAPTVSFYRYYLAIFPVYLIQNKTAPEFRKFGFALTLILGIFTSLLYCINMFFY